ncbi:Pex19-domain-containing protein [Pleomassaria siparia CBS 279.74]|uniref:Pex19-domain-containing protein n=1 Tax=Pleomassaria siparia CBS 279.74 TaxID=1314801 RepID=A0A6G1K2W2_9PLEO|nr:Pex19-domain-containing protein [Pleomassaria siparia CBS 279.74]
MADAPVKEEVAPPASASTTAPAPKQEESKADVASDPEEDDLSDLDDVLDDFANTKIDSKPPTATAPTSHGPERPAPGELLATDQDEFAKQLQAEMENFLGQEDFKQQFEDIMKEMGDVLPPAPGASDAKKEASSPAVGTTSASASASTEKTDKNFQDTIRKTMERMQESGDQASAAAASSDGDDILAQMLKEMEGGGFGEEGNDEDFSKILMGMMEQLTNREVLYEPMKELNDKYPKWMEDNKEKVPKDDLKRYEEQQTLVKEITARFERKGYSDDNSQDREYIVERMQKMQAAGSPPPDLVGEMNAAQEALQEIDQGCPTQ